MEDHRSIPDNYYNVYSGIELCREGRFIPNRMKKPRKGDYREVRETCERLRKQWSFDALTKEEANEGQEDNKLATLCKAYCERSGKERANALNDIRKMSEELIDHVNAMERIFGSSPNIEQYDEMVRNADETPRNVKDEAVKRIIQPFSGDSTCDANCSCQMNSEEPQGSKINPNVGQSEASESAGILYQCIVIVFDRLRTGEDKSPFLGSSCHQEYSKKMKDLRYIILGVVILHSLPVKRQKQQRFSDPEVYYYDFMRLFRYSLESLRRTKSFNDLAASLSALINAIYDQLEFFAQSQVM